MSYTQVYRSGTAQALGALTVGICAAALASLALRGEDQDLLRYAGPVLGVAWAAWFGYWRPRVVIDDEGVTMHNVVRNVHVPWAAVQEVHSRYGLRIETPGASYNAWAVAAPVGRERLRGGDTEASMMVRQRLERLRGLDMLGPAAPVGTDLNARVTWVPSAVLTATAPVCLTLAGLLLTF